MEKKKARINYGAELRSEYARWRELRDRGGTDPFWPDGVNMNLVRNHILHWKRMIEENLQEAEYPEEYFLDIPPEMDNNFMAHPDRIRNKAKAALKTITENPDYVFLRREMRNQTKQNAQIFNAVRYVDGYQDAIRRDDLVVMRRIAPDLYADRFKNARKEYEETKNHSGAELHLGQLTIFDFINAGSDG